MQCPDCGFLNRPDDRFCAKCGARLASPDRVCPACEQTVPAGADFCPHCGEALITQGETRGTTGELAQAPSERKPVTILFTDIVDSTPKAESLDPEEWREVVAGAHKRVGEAVGRYEGTVAQLLGDGVLAYFGTPTTHEDDPERAVRAALDLQEAIQRYAHELSGFIDDFAMRVGIDAGTVVVGEVGSEEKSEYLAIGDVVNVAARLQSAAQPGQIVVSGPIARRVEASFDLEDIGPLKLKGKSDPVQAFVVEGPKAESGRARGLEAPEKIFVGRQRELKELQRSILQLCRGYGGIRFILGEAGIGKSRLVEELRARPPEFEDGELSLALPKDVHWVEGRAVTHASNMAYWLTGQLLLSDLGLTDGAPAPRIRARLHARMDDLLGVRATELGPYLARQLGLELDPVDEERISRYDSETVGRESRRAVVEYFEAVASQAPTVLVLEDLHWADPSSLRTLNELIAVTDRAPLVIVGLMRVERDHGSWELKALAERDYGHRMSVILLEPLDKANAESLIQGVLGGGRIPGGLSGLILARAEGNPLFVEELVRHVIERELILKQEGEWRATQELKRIGIPDTLEGVLLARIDQLDPDVRRTLQLASVVGRTFPYRLLEVISENHDGLQTHLSELQRTDLVREKERLPQLEYMFKHVMTQEAAYNTLLVEERKRLHECVAQAVETQYPDRLDEYTGLLAYHYEAADDIDNAIAYLSAAVDQARVEDSLEEAKDLLHRLISLLKKDSRGDMLARAWMKLGLVHQINFEFDEAHRAYEKAFELEERRGDRREVSPLVDIKPAMKEVEFRVPILMDLSSIPNIDNVSTIGVARLRRQVQAGLAVLDRENNVVPHAARSWEVHDGGLRYVFHLRDDVRWSNGDPVTAADYIDYWRWQLEHVGSSSTSWLSMVKGAEEYRKGASDSLAMHTLTDTSLELRLREPAPHFLYMVAGNGYPASFALLKAHGGDWWLPPHGLYSGPFLIDQWEQDVTVLRRNPYYFGTDCGNLDAVRLVAVDSPSEAQKAYEADQVDMRWLDLSSDLPTDRSSGDQIQMNDAIMAVGCAMFNPTRPPTSDRRFRIAFARSFHRGAHPASLEVGLTPAHGGLVPPGIAGHTPNLAYEFDPEGGRALLDEARAGLPALSRPILISRPSVPGAGTETDEMERALAECARNLDIQLEYHYHREGQVSTYGVDLSPHVFFMAWLADFPDPYTFLVAMVTGGYRLFGWSDPGLDSLISQLPAVRNRKEQMDLFRHIDRYLVREQALVMPFSYEAAEPTLLKPWVKGYWEDASAIINLKYITILDHEA